MSEARILWIEGSRSEVPAFIPELVGKGYDCDIVGTGSAALTRLNEYIPDLIVINAASLRTSGKRICRSLRENSGNLPILLIVDPEFATEEPSANVILTLPFTIRKLVNRIRPLLPAESKRVLHRGPIYLDLENRKVRCQGRESKLTPHLAHLLQILMLNAGSVVERNALFMEVWKTDYVEDTRTLDVHISWLRRIIEENPRKPKFVHTLRGVGYRLDV